jgi:hypothetical protein
MRWKGKGEGVFRAPNIPSPTALELNHLDVLPINFLVDLPQVGARIGKKKAAGTSSAWGLGPRKGPGA